MSEKQVAGAFDVRNVIAALIGAYGVILVVVGLIDGGAAEEKTGGVDANLWAGIGMLVVGLGFATWSRWRPIVVEEKKPREDG
jgi:uncharacterized membrane protein